MKINFLENLFIHFTLLTLSIGVGYFLLNTFLPSDINHASPYIFTPSGSSNSYAQSINPILEEKENKTGLVKNHALDDSSITQPTSTTHKASTPLPEPVKPTLLSNGTLYQQLQHSLNGVTSTDPLQIPFEVGEVTKCLECVSLINNFLESSVSTLSSEQLEQLTQWLTQNGETAFGDKLVTIVKLWLLRDDYTEQAQTLLLSLEALKSAKVAQDLADFMINNPTLSFQTKNAIGQVLENATDRQSVALHLVSQFNNAFDTVTQDNILALGYPEVLETISRKALVEGNDSLYQKTTQLLTDNPSTHTVDVILSMATTPLSSVYTNDIISAETIAAQWATHQLSASRLDYIEAKLVQNTLSPQEKQTILVMLKIVKIKYADNQ